jgi:hypothetical protein
MLSVTNKPIMLSVVMMIVIMLSVVMLIVIMLSVVMLNVVTLVPVKKYKGSIRSTIFFLTYEWAQ